MPRPHTPKRSSIDSLFKFIPNTSRPEPVIDALLDEDDFLNEMSDVVDSQIRATTRNIDVPVLRKLVGRIDDSSQIEMAAFRAGFLFGARYGKRNAGGER